MSFELQVKIVRDTWKKHLQGDEIPEGEITIPSLNVSKSDDRSVSTVVTAPKETHALPTFNISLPDLKDPNRNMGLKRLAEELSGEEVLNKLREFDPESPLLDPSNLRDFILGIEKSKIGD